MSVFYDPKIASWKIVDFVCAFSLSFKDCIWLVHAKYHAFMERNRLTPPDGLFLVLTSELSVGLFAGVIRLLGIANAFGVYFGFHRFCSFFSGIGNNVSVHIVA
ncbi:hypothetical protein G9A89_016563 [Geosiphon pyriformis]|nr:hypothetical protein G9A89_016563 [Geosiphon pyriformis]